TFPPASPGASQPVVVEKLADVSQPVREAVLQASPQTCEKPKQKAVNEVQRRSKGACGIDSKPVLMGVAREIAREIIHVGRVEAELHENAIALAVSLVFVYWPRDAQIDAIVQVLYEKKDMILIAKTAFGKSTVLQSVSLLQQGSATPVILPLDRIGNEQEAKIQNPGGKPFFLNKATNTPESRK
ncbi:hypothetical protein KEM55_002704, partial [Ascosphaera atra]